MTKKGQQYFEGVGRRKTSIARVRIAEAKKDNEIVVNGKKASEYFGTEEIQGLISSPLRATSTEDGMSVTISVKGGGKQGQAEAIRMGISRALIKFNAEFHRALRDLDYLKRDPRKKERKKPGLKKARRAPQWAKR